MNADDFGLIKLAAKSTNLEIHESTDGTMQNRPILATTHYVMGQPYCEIEWNPLRDDATAFELAVLLSLHIFTPGGEPTAVARNYPTTVRCEEDVSNNPFAATRRAIVRAAAELGKLK